ncbi:MAG: glyoxalase/bleomycin resistance/extradiol dioxygenase family protein [Acidobacteria bacterium]|nr:glyoxalase/bleomycin resistance/extradiol dioxygenase family protein [Acidobacteriota bacterium]
MPVQNLSPYLHFDGVAAEAIRLYQEAFGAKAVTVMPYSDMPNNSFSEEQRKLVMHSELSIGESALLLSDKMPGMPPREGGNGEVLLNFHDAASLQKAFDVIAATGKPIMPPHDSFWGARFGVAVDKFGVWWSFHSPRDAA